MQAFTKEPEWVREELLMSCQGPRVKELTVLSMSKATEVHE